MRVYPVCDRRIVPEPGGDVLSQWQPDGEAATPRSLLKWERNRCGIGVVTRRFEGNQSSDRVAP